MSEKVCQFCKRTGTPCAETMLTTEADVIAALRGCRIAMADRAVSAEAKLQAVREVHECADPNETECDLCGVFACPKHEALHFHHDGCPACDA